MFYIQTCASCLLCLYTLVLCNVNNKTSDSFYWNPWQLNKFHCKVQNYWIIWKQQRQRQQQHIILENSLQKYVVVLPWVYNGISWYPGLYHHHIKMHHGIVTRPFYVQECNSEPWLIVQSKSEQPKVLRGNAMSQPGSTNWFWHSHRLCSCQYESELQIARVFVSFLDGWMDSWI